MPDQASNREAFGRPSAGRGQAEFPQVRLTALVEVGTRAALAWEQDLYRESEQAQARRLQAHLESGMLLLADRNDLGIRLFDAAAATGAELLWRVRNDRTLPPKEVYADGSFRGAAGQRPVRVVGYRLEEGDEERYRLVTTLLDLAALYHQRWELETAYDAIRTHMLGRARSCAANSPSWFARRSRG